MIVDFLKHSKNDTVSARTIILRPRGCAIRSDRRVRPQCAPNELKEARRWCGFDDRCDNKCKRCRLCMHWALRSGNGDIDLDVDSIHVTIRDCSRYPRTSGDLISKLNSVCSWSIPIPRRKTLLHWPQLVHKARSVEASTGRVRTKTYCHAPQRTRRQTFCWHQQTGILASGSPLYSEHQYQQLAPYRLQYRPIDQNISGRRQICDCRVLRVYNLI
jgi:hypothetical protein